MCGHIGSDHPSYTARPPLIRPPARCTQGRCILEKSTYKNTYMALFLFIQIHVRDPGALAGGGGASWWRIYDKTMVLFSLHSTCRIHVSVRPRSFRIRVDIIDRGRRVLCTCGREGGSGVWGGYGRGRRYDMEEHGSLGDPICVSTLSNHCNGPFR